MLLVALLEFTQREANRSRAESHSKANIAQAAAYHHQQLYKLAVALHKYTETALGYGVRVAN